MLKSCRTGVWGMFNEVCLPWTVNSKPSWTFLFFVVCSFRAASLFPVSFPLLNIYLSLKCIITLPSYPKFQANAPPGIVLFFGIKIKQTWRVIPDHVLSTEWWSKCCGAVLVTWSVVHLLHFKNERNKKKNLILMCMTCELHMTDSIQKVSTCSQCTVINNLNA